MDTIEIGTNSFSNNGLIGARGEHQFTFNLPEVALYIRGRVSAWNGTYQPPAFGFRIIEEPPPFAKGAGKVIRVSWWIDGSLPATTTQYKVFASVITPRTIYGQVVQLIPSPGSILLFSDFNYGGRMLRIDNGAMDLRSTWGGDNWNDIAS